MRASRWIVHSRRNPSAILLSVQLLGMLVYPFIEGTEAGRIAFGVFGITVLIVTARMVRTTPGLTWVSAGIALPAILLQIVQAFQLQPVLLAVSAGLEAVFYFYAAGSLIAWAFTGLFVLLQALRPGSFAAAVNPEQLRTWAELMYLSFALPSGTGIGDVIPLSPITRAVAAFEMFVGVMYLAAVVSRLIGLTLIQHGAPGTK